MDQNRHRGGVAPAGLDLNASGPLPALIRWRGFPAVFQALILSFLLGIAALGWGLYPPVGVPGKLFAKANLASLVIWGLWWPFMVIAMVGLGRVWCAVCPLELTAHLAERAGRRLGIKQRALRRSLRGGALVVALYALIQMLVFGVHLHRVPAYTSLYVLALIGTAAAIGLFFKHRAFCYGFCPVGLMLQVYARGGAIAVRPRAGAGEGAAVRDCPSLLNPSTLDHNRDCLLCGRCVKSHPAQMSYRLRLPFTAADSREPLPSRPATLFIVLVTGFVTSELCSEWKAAQEFFQLAPHAFASFVGLKSVQGWVDGLWTIAVFPALLFGLFSALASIPGGRPLLALRGIAFPLAVVAAFGQMAKALAKITSWAGYLPLALANPKGESAAAIAAKTIPEPAPLLSAWTVSALAAIQIVAGIALAARELKLTGGANGRAAFIPIFLLGGLYLFLVLGWGLVSW